MGNCLVTKLKAVVDNDNLNKLGVIKVFLTPYESSDKYYVNLNLGNTQHGISILDNTALSTYHPANILELINSHKANYLGTADSSSSALIQVAENDTVTLEIDNKYTLKSFNFYRNTSVRVKNGLKNLPSTIEEIAIHNYGEKLSTKELSVFQNIKIINLENTFYSFEGQMSDLSTLTDLEKLRANSAHNLITGNIKDIGRLTKLTEFAVSGNTGIIGSLEEFVAEQRLAGRTEESTGINFSWGIKNVTFNGNSTLTNHTCTLTWTADTITFDGVTISA